VKPDIDSVQVHPQLSHEGHPVDGALAGAGPVWPSTPIPGFLSRLKQNITISLCSWERIPLAIIQISVACAIGPSVN